MHRNQRQNIADVIIIGAGPAGAMAAQILSKAGIPTIILEKKEIVGYPNHCGEGISHHVLNFLGIDAPREWIVKIMKGTKIFFPNGGFLYYPQKSYCINRTLFDQILIEKAITHGAHVLLARRVASINLCDKKWHVTTSSGEIFMSTYLIAADGATSTVRKLFSKQMYCIGAIQYKFSPIERYDDEYFVFFNNEKHHPGYAWIFSRGCETSIGLGGIGNVKQKLESFLTSLSIDPARRISVHHGAIPHPACPVTIALPGVLFAGDAGGFTCPLTGGGIIGALMSGKVAGEVIRDALVSKQAEILSSYPERMRFHPSRSRSTLFYSRKFFLLNNDELETLGNIINQHIYSTIPMWRALRYLAKKPRWQTINAYMIGFAAQQILRHYKKFIF
jgi:digeranylgeranylglycerophospholipid reductase